jgi:hypothetical protein
MTLPPDLFAILPLIAAVLAAVAVLTVDLALPGRRNLVVGTALVSLAVTALAILWAGACARSTGPTRSTR